MRLQVSHCQAGILKVCDAATAPRSQHELLINQIMFDTPGVCKGHSLDTYNREAGGQKCHTWVPISLGAWLLKGEDSCCSLMWGMGPVLPMDSPQPDALLCTMSQSLPVCISIRHEVAMCRDNETHAR